MKTKKKILIGLMSLCLATGIGTAFAMGTQNASNVNIEGQMDSAIVVDYGSTSITENKLAALENLTAGVTQYRYIDFHSTSTKSVDQDVTITMSLKAEAAYGLKGLTMVVKPTTALDVAPGEVEAALTVAGVAGSATLATEASGNFTINCDGDGSAKTETHHYYQLAFTYDGSQQTTGCQFGGGLLISLALA